MIEIEDVIEIHKILIDRYGGIHGIRNRDLLESALHRPYSTFDKKDLYVSVEAKAAALVESILINHPFVDGNKRIGYTLMRLLLLNNGKDINASENEKYDFVIGIASGKIKFEQILAWIKANSYEE